MLRRSMAIFALTASVLVFAAPVAAGGGCHWESAKPNQSASSAGEVTAHIAGCRYEPTTLYIEPGTTVTWINKDPVPHSVTGPFLTLGGDKLLDQAESTSVTFSDAGVYPYYCVLHYGMAASVVVGDPMDAVASADTIPLAGSDRPQPPSTGGESSNDFPLAAGIGAIAIVGIGASIVVVRKRRRALPVPGALP